MYSLQEPKVLHQGTIIGSPLLVPTNTILSVEEVKRWLFRRVDHIFTESEFEVAQLQAKPWVWCWHDFFAESMDDNVIHVGSTMNDMILRIVPDELLSLDELGLHLLMWDQDLDKSLNRWYITDLSYDQALLEVQDIILWDEDTELWEFEDRYLNQIDSHRDQLLKWDLSERRVFQVTSYGAWKVIGLPKDIFVDDNDGGDTDRLLDKIKIPAWLLPWAEPAWI